MVMPRPCVDRGGPGLSFEPLVAFIGQVFASYEAGSRHGHDFFWKNSYAGKNLAEQKNVTASRSSALQASWKSGRTKL